MVKLSYTKCVTFQEHWRIYDVKVQGGGGYLSEIHGSPGPTCSSEHNVIASSYCAFFA